ncbi:PREDICTED: uncharacterized protein LOC104709909 [Camelina sativa]|uniref:Uncharacterized protein LOC104709909 n=1 Tax=Camelina sativa TaxID=90675 RepID=A0ABM0TDI4_CAMSA|nr:PREDICTED: uncharacterized protein LOC104709909 [Camelina sativa]
MWCVTSVEYSVLLNGQPRGSIVPARGLRQGDPLSSYLFILCTEVLIANLRKAERSKLITGIKVSTACPTISHLLFADDSLFFCRATKEQCEVILGILREYERISGQRINFQKSSVQFGHTVDAGVREDLKGILGITTLGGMSSYLGIPESLGGSKTNIFSFVQDRLQKRAGGWPARLLSRGGKEVMIKSVATVVPTFVMSCFRIPKTVTRKLTSAISNFWWCSSGETRGLHWIAWDRLCADKTEGGLGFRCLDDFNTALLAKQLWRLISVPDSLFAKVFKGRYYRHSDPLDPIKSYFPYYGWRSLISARSLVNKGLIKRVGTGASISVWSDPWIPAQSPRPALCSGSPVDPTLRVENFIDRTSRSWDLALLSASFEAEDVALISALPLGNLSTPDSLGWHLTKTGVYTVKSGYQALRQKPESGLPISGPNIIPLQTFVWQIRCPPKLRHFLWQAITGCMATTANLRRRGLSCDMECTICEGRRRQLIMLSFYVLRLGRFQDIPSVDMFPWILWYIWKARNDKLFSNLDSNPVAIIRLVEEESRLWSSAQDDLPGSLPSSIPRPPSRVMTQTCNTGHGFGSSHQCFVDGSWKATDQFMARGWYCISPVGEFPTMGASNSRRSLLPLHAEVEALVWAMRCMIGADNEKVVFLTDCSDLVKMVSSPSEWPAFKTYLDAIEEDKGEFLSFSLVQVPRSQNGRADKLARRARVESLPITFVNNFPFNWLV